MMDGGDLSHISHMRILVIGADALGCAVCSSLADAGFRRMVVLDPASVSPSDVDDQIFFDDDRGIRYRSECLARELCKVSGVHAAYSCSSVRSIDGWDYDLLISCSRPYYERVRINRFARMYRIPYVDGIASGSMGRVQTVLESGPCLECVTTGRSCSPICSCTAQVLRRTAGAMVAEAMKIGCRNADGCIHGVLYLGGSESEDCLVHSGVSSRCINHKRERYT